MSRLTSALLLAWCCWCLSSELPTVSAGNIRFRALSRSSEAGVLTAVRRQLDKLATGLPSGVICPTCLIASRPRVRSRVVQGSVPRSRLAEAARSRGLPGQVVSRLQALAFSRSVVFHSFAFEVNTRVGRGHYVTFVGAGRRLGGDTVEFGVVQSSASGQLVAKWTPVRRRRCKRRFFIKRCRSRTERVPRGLTAQELRRVESALRHSAVTKAAAQLRNRSRSRLAKTATSFDLAQ